MAGRPTTGPPIGPPVRQPAPHPLAQDAVAAEPSLAWRRVRSALSAALLIEVAALAITGIALWFAYRPTPSQAWPDIFATGELSSSQQLSETLRWSHALAGSLAVLTAAATALALCFGPGAPLRRMRGKLAATALVVAMIAALVTGPLLPWDQIAYRSVRVGSGVTGFGTIFDDDVLFVLKGGFEVDPASLIRWLVVHVAVLGPLVIGLAAFVWRRRSATQPVSW